MSHRAARHNRNRARERERAKTARTARGERRAGDDDVRERLAPRRIARGARFAARGPRATARWRLRRGLHDAGEPRGRLRRRGGPARPQALRGRRAGGEPHAQGCVGHALEDQLRRYRPNFGQNRPHCAQGQNMGARTWNKRPRTSAPSRQQSACCTSRASSESELGEAESGLCSPLPDFGAVFRPRASASCAWVCPRRISCIKAMRRRGSPTAARHPVEHTPAQPGRASKSVALGSSKVGLHSCDVGRNLEPSRSCGRVRPHNGFDDSFGSTSVGTNPGLLRPISGRCRLSFDRGRPKLRRCRPTLG